MKTRMLLFGGTVCLALTFVTAEEDGDRDVPAVKAGDIVLLPVEVGTRDQVVVYHKGSQSFLVYGVTNRSDFTMRLLQIRRLEDDLKLAEVVKELPYEHEGYTSAEVKALLDKSPKKEEEKGKRKR